MYEIDDDIKDMSLLEVMRGIRDETPRLILHVLRNGMLVQTDEGVSTVTPSAAWLNAAQRIISLMYDAVVSEEDESDEPDDPVLAAIQRRARATGHEK